MIIGFTGTRKGMTAAQLDRLMNLLIDVNVVTLHHGDCVGADEEAQDIARQIGSLLVVHPPDNPKLRAFCDGTILAAKNYLARNRDIVDSCQLLIAAVKELKEPTHPRAGGPWYTIRYARKVGRSFRVIWPDGEVYGE